MVSCCINPACHTEFRFLNTGGLYALERQSVNTEFFWLCSACVPLVALSLDLLGNVCVGPKCDAVHQQHPHPDRRLRLVYRPMERTPWLRAGLARGLALSSEYLRDPLPSSSSVA